MSEITSALKVHSLVCHKHVDMALACLGSLLRYSAEPLHIYLHDDGSLRIEDKDRLSEGLNNAKIILRSEADELINQRLRNYPNAAKYRYEHALALKLLDIPLLEERDIAYCDSDILFFKPFSRLFQLPNSETSSIFMMDKWESYSIRPWHLLGSNRLKLPSKV
ncbi:MAG: hypothetical protein QNJ46_20820, partial [Leptolyngbyaceae cyanobacterium MO_188.B28]|nr:hypothetical protein [Leptolyngbyaceae cyanobacterium MO_188.B28]